MCDAGVSAWGSVVSLLGVGRMLSLHSHRQRTRQTNRHGRPWGVARTWVHHAHMSVLLLLHVHLLYPVAVHCPAGSGVLLRFGSHQLGRRASSSLTWKHRLEHVNKMQNDCREYKFEKMWPLGEALKHVNQWDTCPHGPWLPAPA